MSNYITVKLMLIRCIFLMFSLSAVPVWSAPANIVASSVSPAGEYSITWDTGGGNVGKLEERVGSSGSWQQISDLKVGSKSFQKFDGTYFYRLHKCIIDFGGGGLACSIVVNNIMVEVKSAPPEPPVLTGPQALTYTYDELGRLTESDDSISGKRIFDYDRAGNRISVSVSTLPAPTVLSVSGPHSGNGGFTMFWDAVAGAQYYVISTNSTVVPAQNGVNSFDSQGRSTWVRACNATSCGPKSYF